MRRFEYLLFLGTKKEPRWRRYVSDAIMAACGAMIVTGVIFLFHLYPTIPDISLLYLLIVLGLASTRGLYAALVASVIAFLSFDFFMIPPFFTLTIDKFEEWLALFIFLVTAIITGQLAAALKQRAEQAMQSEREARTLYELVDATTREEELDAQLNIIVRALVNVFAAAGVRDCAILLPDERGRLTLRADALLPPGSVRLSADEQKTAELVMVQGQTVDLHGETGEVPAMRGTLYHRIRRVMREKQESYLYIRVIPLYLGQKIVGVLRLLIAHNASLFALNRNRGNGNHADPQVIFFRTFLDQAAAVIERARLHRENLQVELLRRTDALRSALLSSVSHDLRTPLSSIKAAASSLLQNDVQWSEEERRSFAMTIEREADRLNRLVGNLLDMSRIEGGALKPEKEWYPLDELIHDVLERMQSQFQGRMVRTMIPGDLPPVKLDYLQMDQVMTNLVENALRYTPAGSPVDIAVAVIDRQVLVSVADRGPGIPPGDLERIFDKFYRVTGTKNRGTSTMGTGLGLAVCRGLVEAHGGHIWAENRPQGGAVFKFTLPLDDLEEQKVS